MLRQGKASWNKWRNRNLIMKVDLMHAELRNANLRFMDLDWANLRGANLCEADLSGADLINAHLEGVDLRAAELSSAHVSDGDLSSADLRGANLRNTDLSGANLSNADLRQAKFSETNLEGAKLDGADLRQTNLRKATLRGASFNEANIGNADLRGLCLSGEDFNGANLSGSDLSSADLSNALLSKALLVGANLNDALLNGANLIKAKLNGANLSGADLVDANLHEANASATILRSANLREARFNGANLNKADLSQARLEGATLSGSNLSNSNLNDARMTNADLSNANLSGSDLRGADFDSANLQGANLDGCNITGVSLWETQRAGWSIKGIICERAYWDKDGKEPTVYAPGEFERLYSDQTVIELFYRGGVSTFELNTLPALLHHLATLHPGSNIRLKSIEETGGGARISISVGDANPEATEKIKADAMKVYQAQLALRDRETERLQIERDYIERLFFGKLIPAMLNAGTPQNVFNAPVTGMVISGNDSKVDFHQTINDNSALLALLEKMMDRTAALGLSAPAATKLESEIATATTELQKKNPDKSVLSRSLGFIQKLATEAAAKAAGKLGEAAITDWQTWLHQLGQLAHHIK